MKISASDYKSVLVPHWCSKTSYYTIFSKTSPTIMIISLTMIKILSTMTKAFLSVAHVKFLKQISEISSFTTDTTNDHEQGAQVKSDKISS